MKTFKKICKNKEKMNREVYFLKKLENYECFPKILNTKDKEIEMSFCGEVFYEKKDPKYWKRQLKKILKILEKENIYHNDMHKNNFLCKEDKIYLIDFDLASEGEEAIPFGNAKSVDLNLCDSFGYFLMKVEQHRKKKYRL